MKLYELSNSFTQLFDNFDAICSYEMKSNELGEPVDDDGNVISDIEAYMEESRNAWFDVLCRIEGEFEQKAENVAAYIKGLKAEADELKTEEENLKRRRQVKENQIGYLKKYLLSEMQAIGRTKIDRPMAKLSIRQNAESVQIADEKEFVRMCEEKELDRFLRFKAPEIDKSAVKKALQSGQKVQGAGLTRTQSLIIK